MKSWYKPWTWFQKKPEPIIEEPNIGAFVEVNLDYGFGAIAGKLADFKHTLHITDLSPAEARVALAGKRFEWHSGTAEGLAPFSHWRRNLELGHFHQATWEEVLQYLKDWVG